MKKILVIGDSNFTKVVIDIIEDEGEFEIFGVIDCLNVGKEYLNYNVVGRKEDIPKIIEENNIYGGVLAIDNNWMRKEIYSRVQSICGKFNFITIIHPTAIIGKNVIIGSGSLIMAGVVINSDAIIGEFCLLKMQSSLGHEGLMEKYSSLSFGVITGGNLKLGTFSKISFSTSVIENIKIGAHSFIGAGSLVLKNIPSFSVAFGVPANKSRNRKKNEEHFSEGYQLTIPLN
jgi:sugar O-acyltransferase (sialic acid O-acetyltransferase NeuD family)